MDKWNYHSAVTPCPPCEGKGAAPNRPWLSNGDPDCWDVECEACEGVGHHACAVCGFDHSIPGYDCLICEAVADIPASVLEDHDTALIIAAFAKALDAARSDAERSHAAARLAAMTPAHRAQLEGEWL